MAKNLSSNAGDMRFMGSIPGLGRSPEGGHGNILQYSCLENPAETLLLNHEKTPGFLASGGEEFNPGPETRLDRSELLCNKVLLKYKRDRENF